MMPYGIINLSQHWFRYWLVAWWHQAITWTSVDILSLGFCSIHLETISEEVLRVSVLEIGLNVTLLESLLLLFGLPPCQRSDMTLVEVSQHAYDYLYIRTIVLFVFLRNSCKPDMVLVYIFVEWILSESESESLRHLLRADELNFMFFVFCFFPFHCRIHVFCFHHVFCSRLRPTAVTVVSRQMQSWIILWIHLNIYSDALQFPSFGLNLSDYNLE